MNDGTEAIFRESRHDCSIASLLHSRHRRGDIFSRPSLCIASVHAVIVIKCNRVAMTSSSCTQQQRAHGARLEEASYAENPSASVSPNVDPAAVAVMVLSCMGAPVCCADQRRPLFTCIHPPIIHCDREWAKQKNEERMNKPLLGIEARERGGFSI